MAEGEPCRWDVGAWLSLHVGENMPIGLVLCVAAGPLSWPTDLGMSWGMDLDLGPTKIMPKIKK